MPVTDEPHSAREKERAGERDRERQRWGEKTRKGDGGGVEEVQRTCQSSGCIY